ncbi:MAG: hypothetical protein HIU93_15745 [Acidobacteria bacterium]|nr:hypothetical protein [Acidobacteriota bacterium]
MAPTLLEEKNRVGIDDARWKLVQRVVQSDSFAKATRLSSFLLYVCERELLGHSDEISEQQIGIHVFGRHAGYNPADDNIVRTTARLVRQRLDLYFLQEGSDEHTRIQIPKGGYIPVFEERRSLRNEAVAELSMPPTAVDAVIASARPIQHGIPIRPPKLSPLQAIALTAIALLTVVAGVFFYRAHQALDSQSALWRQLFPGPQPTYLVPGDSGLVLFENLTHKSVNLDAYSQGTYREQGGALPIQEGLHPAVEGRRYTSIPDLEFATKLAALPQAQNGKLRVRYARDLKMGDLKAGNVILVGDPEGNPWVNLFSANLNFQFMMDEATAVHTIVNVHPRNGEQQVYLCSPSDPQRHAYALVALVHNLSGRGNVLLVEGTTMAGIDAAADFLFDEKRLNQILMPARSSDGTIKNFEVLLGTQNVDASSSQFSILSERVH